MKRAIADKRFRERGGEVVGKVRASRPDVGVFDVGVGEYADEMQRKGVVVWGANKWSDALCSDESYAQRVLRSAGVHTLDLQRVGEELNIGVSCGAWWIGRELYNHHVIVRDVGFMTDSVGVGVTGGVVVKPVPARSKVVQLTVARLVEVLRKTRFRGPVFIDHTLRAGFRLEDVCALAELLSVSWGDAFLGVVGGLRWKVGIGVRVTLPPFPHEGKVEGGEFVVSTGARKHLWLKDAKEERAPIVDGDVGWATAAGRDVNECRRRVYRTLERIRAKRG
ncbi:MAG: hypothetical protein ACXQT3_01850, partial [Methermicoccaceae archaeon]